MNGDKYIQLMRVCRRTLQTEAIQNANFFETGFETLFCVPRKRSKENCKLRILSLLKYLELFTSDRERHKDRNNLKLPNNKITRHFDRFKFNFMS